MLASLVVVLFLFILDSHGFVTSSQGIQGGCRMAYMSPHYLHLDAFNGTRLSRKYSLHLYREAGWDVDPRHGLLGTPVLFVPGNAGSYKQVRSIAASAARQYYSEPGVISPAHFHQRNLDFFALDFNEDFSAFHGQTILEQAQYAHDAIKYIFGLYASFGEMRQSIQVIAHSMGGIAASSILLLPDYLPGTITNLVTLSTPHASPPAPFDQTMDSIYSRLKFFWASARNEIGSKENLALQDLLLVSIAGGRSDSMIASDSTHIHGLAESDHFVSLYTTSIPDLFASVDHLAILWCDQLRTKIAESVLKASSLQSLQERRRAFLDSLLLHDADISGHPPYIHSADSVLIMAETINATTLALRVPNDAQTLKVWVARPSEALHLSACVDEICSVLAQDAVHMLRIPKSRSNWQTSNEDPLDTVFLISLHNAPTRLLLRSTHSLVPTDVIAVNGSLGKAQITLHWTIIGLMLKAHEVELPKRLITSIALPELASGLVVYRISSNCQACDSPNLAPLLHVFADSTRESHWLPNHSHSTVHLHFSPTGGKAKPFNGMQIDVYRDPSCLITIIASIDVVQSFKVVFWRHRLFLAAWPAALAMQFLVRHLDTQESLAQITSHFVKRKLGQWSAYLSLIAFAQSMLWRQRLFDAIHLDEALLGFHGAIYVPLVPIFVVLSFCVVCAIGCVLMMLSHIVAKVKSALPPMPVKDRHATLQYGLPVILLSFLVTFFAPQNFVILAITALAVFKAPNPGSSDFYVLLTLICILPVAAPMLVVWVRNLAVGWWQPFSSDRNVLWVLGYLFWYLAVDLPIASHSGQTRSRSFDVRSLHFASTAIFVFGVRHAWITPKIFNAWLIAFTIRPLLQQKTRPAPASVEGEASKE